MTGTVAANRSGKCSDCDKPIRVGDMVKFKKGMRKDGSEVNIPVHSVCPPGEHRSIPPTSGASTTDGTKGTLPPALSSGTPPGPNPNTNGENWQWVVSPSAWIHSNRIPLVLKALEEARQ